MDKMYPDGILNIFANSVNLYTFGHLQTLHSKSFCNISLSLFYIINNIKIK